MLQDKPWLFFVVYHHAYVPQERGVQSGEVEYSSWWFFFLLLPCTPTLKHYFKWVIRLQEVQFSIQGP